MTSEAMTLQEQLDVLLTRQAVIVHCAGSAKGTGNNETNALGFLDRLRFAIGNNVELPCSTIVPGDGNEGWRMNYTGKAGLILVPKLADSITYACAHDVGSQIDPERPGRRSHFCGPMTLASLEAAIDGRQDESYNELGVLNYAVLGVFFETPIQYVAQDESLCDVTIGEVAAVAPELPFYELRTGYFHQVIGCDGSGLQYASGPLSGLQIYGSKAQ